MHTQVCPPMHTRMHIHTGRGALMHKHTYTQAHTNAHIPCTGRRAPAHTHRQRHTHTDTHARTHMHTYTHTHYRTHTHSLSHAHTHTQAPFIQHRKTHARTHTQTTLPAAIQWCINRWALKVCTKLCACLIRKGLCACLCACLTMCACLNTYFGAYLIRTCCAPSMRSEW